MHKLPSMLIAAALVAMSACDRAGSPDTAAPTAAPTPASSTPAQAPASAPPSATGGTPRIGFQKTIHDFGVVTDSQNYFTTFRFTNTGTGTLVISEVKATCGCTVPTLEKNEYAPGESATLNVTFDPSGKAKKQLQTVSVISNARPSVVKLVIQADVRPVVHYDFFLRFGTLELGREHTRRAELQYSDPDLAITDLSVTNPHVTVTAVDMGKPNPDPDGLPYLGALEVTIGSDAPWGLLQNTQVKFTARGRAAEQFATASVPYTMWVNAQLYGDVRADPVVLTTMDSMGRGQRFKLTTELSRTSGAPFSVTDIELTETSMSGLKPLFTAKDAGTWLITLEGTTPNAKGAVNGFVTVTTDVPGEERISIQFAMYVK